MVGMRFRAGHLFSGDIKTEIFSASITEFKGVPIKNPTAHLTATDLHPQRVRGLRLEVGG
jgi:hypothetical protein